VKKIQYEGAAYRRRLLSVLTGFCLTSVCKRCGSPTIKGYCCTFCGCGCGSVCDCDARAKANKNAKAQP
jgi:hypothetical protein